jgi:cyclase
VLATRVIPCLDVKDGRVVKGVGFQRLRDAGDPVELAAYYDAEGADELVFLDVSASHERRDILLDVVKRTAEVLFIPFMVGGGIRSLHDIREILYHGADKIAVNTAAVEEPFLIRESAEMFGSQCIVASIDVKRVYVEDERLAPGKVVLDTPSGKCWWDVYIYGGREAVGIDAVQWAEMAAALGAGEIVASSLDFDGTQQGYDTIYLREVSERVTVPLIASSGAGSPEHILEAITEGKADAVLAASMFHYGTYTIRKVKKYLATHGIPVRLE